ncbi:MULTISPECIES: DUF4169 family protein [Leisingera]|jgi:hypothetical protein|uniref:DUF4169 family protein n=1 Tax=Leisingera TaxID=191028 RepID=UPI00030EFFA8|nr:MULTISPECIES: DUF4169 family protein [Leisingera]QDI75603.1 DUF4169 family protein [Leisingera aquaemixtae]UWQ35807.1 DUF4169 family protein [Leisingera aquaemixtae]UWQ44168.1 DUF4169 family protein [Leisingera aquaemixtae]
MEKPVNLNRYRKEKARAEKKARADRNAVTFGRTKAEKDLDKARNAQEVKRLDEHKRDE